jgi:hypothetical protein
MTVHASEQLSGRWRVLDDFGPTPRDVIRDLECRPAAEAYIAGFLDGYRDGCLIGDSLVDELKNAIAVLEAPPKAERRASA